MNDHKYTGYRSGLDSVFSSEAIAQFKLACELEQNQEFSAAAARFKSASMMGHRDAAYRVGLLCLKGSDRIRREAAFWFQKAASFNNPDALYQLGLLYEQGLGVRQDIQHAVRLWHSAAQGGSESARTKVASLPSALARITWPKLESRQSATA